MEGGGSQSPTSKGLDDHTLYEHYITIPPDILEEAQPLVSQPPSPPARRRIPSTPALHATGNHRIPATALPKRRFGRLKDNWVYAIPIVVLFFFLVWCLSSPVNMAVKDGRTMNVLTTEEHVSLTDPYYDLGRLAILAVSNSPIPSIPISLTMTHNADDAHPASNKTSGLF